MTTVVSSMHLNGQDDPLSLLLSPPANESAAAREQRLRQEAAARQRSDVIDEEIRAEREALKKKRSNEVRLLLLGQSSSGKSTLQKQFQLMYAPYSLDLERSSWRPVVYINIVKTIRLILEALEFEYEPDYDTDTPISSSIRAPRSSTNSISLIPSYGLSSPSRPATASGSGLASSSKPSSPMKRPISGKHPMSPAPDSDSDKEREVSSGGDEPPSPPLSGRFIDTADSLPPVPSDAHLSWPQQLATLRLRLLPILSMEQVLFSKIGRGVKVAPGKEEVFVRHGWQGIKRKAASLKGKEVEGKGPRSSSETQDSALKRLEERDETVKQFAHLLVSQMDDILTLWNHSTVRGLIKKRKLRLEESSTFFLDNLNRIAVPSYVPVDDDILYARLRTMGVVEHQFEVPVGTGPKTLTWRLYDVGGARGQRPSWVPYFEDANAIIFLAPISAFDQYLEEDGRTNRVDDSLQLFTLICSNPLLKSVHLVLFLNKIDVLRRKLDSGVKVKKYITSYGDRPNEYGPVSAYFAAHFKQVHRKNNVGAKRELYTHLTSVVDTVATQNIIMNVRDAIFRDHLKESSMI